MTDKCKEAMLNLILSAYSANLNKVNLHTEEDKVESLKHLVGANTYIELLEHWLKEVETHCDVKFDKELESETAFKEKEELKPMIDEIEEYFEITPEMRAKLEKEIKEREKRKEIAYV